MNKLIIALLLLGGCASKPKLDNLCLDGHVYYHNRDYLALKVDDDGKPIKCKD